MEAKCSQRNRYSRSTLQKLNAYVNHLQLQVIEQLFTLATSKSDIISYSYFLFLNLRNFFSFLVVELIKMIVSIICVFVALSITCSMGLFLNVNWKSLFSVKFWARFQKFVTFSEDLAWAMQHRKQLVWFLLIACIIFTPKYTLCQVMSTKFN